MAEESRGSWWSTLPGVLTAAAAFLTAVTGLALALHQLGLIGGSASSGAQPQVSTSVTSSVGSGSDGGGTGQSSGTRATTGTAADQRYAVALPLHEAFRLGDASYELLTARVRADADGQIALELTVRMRNYRQYDANFWDSSFHVDVGADTYQASGGLNEIVSGESTNRGTVLFLLPDATRKGVLQLRFGERRKSLSFAITAAR